MKSHPWRFVLRLVPLLLAAQCFSPSLRADDVPPTRPTVVKVACIGDSITFGSGLTDRHKESYPAQLQVMFDEAGGGRKWEVQNFGVSGATLLKKGDRPYWDQKRFAAAKQFNPDLVIIKLGTNDSKPPNWEHKTGFAADLAGLIEAFRALPSRPDVWVCRPVPAFPGKYGIRDEIIRKEILPIIDAVAKEQNVPIIDLYTALSDQPEHFPDTIHPNADGARVMAREVHKALIGSLKEATTRISR